MPTKCSVNSCESFYSKGVPFFDVPSPIKYKFCTKKAELSKKRRKLWLDAMGIANDSSNMFRICSKHFIKGKPAALEDTKSRDWVPTLHMRSRKSKREKEASEKQRKLSQNSYSSKKNASRHSRSATKSSRRYDERKDKIIKKDIRKSSKRIDLKKFLNCKVILDGNIQCTIFKGTNGSDLTIAQKYGYFTSDNVTVKESALNNTVLRIHLIREDLLGLKRKYEAFKSPSRTKRKELIVSSFGRQIKRKSHFEESIHFPLRKSFDTGTTQKTRYSLVSGKSDRQMKEQNIKQEGFITVNNKIHLKNVEKNISNDSKTLNRVIGKHYRDKIKIRLFPKTSTPIRIVNNGSVIPEPGKPLQLRREVLFVKKYKNSRLWNNTETTYFLKFAPIRCPEDGTLDYSFQKLVTDVKHLKLPAPSWKIKVIIRQRKISAITFTNKLELERCVAFSANSDKYRIIIDNKPALLLGSPDHIRNSKDLEIVLDIVQNIDSKDPMVFYK